MMNKEVVARGLGISNNKGLDAAINHVKNSKVLPIADNALSSRCQDANVYIGSYKYIIMFEETGSLQTLSAVADVAVAIKSGLYEIGNGDGLESMTVDQRGRTRYINSKVLLSHKCAAAANAAGKFKDEPVPVSKVVSCTCLSFILN
ncbi:hypothetical protein POM88_052918 [Heracleum sosnowskyi]|uniref:Uncharacterized protein n=1 Tax=Heracleum sosnowskyi TaxID=360622 RepID=A0AAD8GRX5_9APIA|nr:hypothetical protein POM88_052918 [Heracleum sosnowskyi]